MRTVARRGRGGAGRRDGAVRRRHNIGVFHEIDFISAFGHTPGERLTVEVFRGDHRIARVAAPALATPGGAGLEINHGPRAPRARATAGRR